MREQYILGIKFNSSLNVYSVKLSDTRHLNLAPSMPDENFKPNDRVSVVLHSSEVFVRDTKSIFELEIGSKLVPLLYVISISNFAGGSPISPSHV